jgi:hypothetical protein
MTKPAVTDLPVIQKAYDLVKWYVPILNRLPGTIALPWGSGLFRDSMTC